MFGYIIPDKPNLMMKDYTLYRALYCGICVTLGKKYGMVSRVTTNYDMTFLSALLHNFLGEDVEVDNSRCILHPIAKRPIAKSDSVTEKICLANVFLVYYKLTDDILDEGKFKKKFARNRLKKAYKIAKKQCPTLDCCINDYYRLLRKLEKENSKSIDMLSDSFGNMMKSICQFVLEDKTTEQIEKLAYFFGKWVYLIDGLDDLEKDFEQKQFNPFISSFDNYKTRQQFIDDNRSEIDFILISTINEINKNYAELKMKFNRDLTDNIVYAGIPARTKGVVEGTMCGKTPKI